MNRKLNLCLLQLLVAALTAISAGVAQAQVYINEIYSNPPNAPSALDLTAEYIELRGTPSMSLTNYYLILVDTLDNSFHTGPAGTIQHVFNLNGRSMGTNGFLTIRQQGNGYAVAPGTTDLVNGLPAASCTGGGCGPGFGSGTANTNPATKSSIGASDSNTNGEIASGFTAMLIRNDSGTAPAITTPLMDLDVGNNGLDVATGRVGWTILDSIGFTETGEYAFCRYYGKINYGPEVADLNTSSPTYFNPALHLEPGATYVATGVDPAHPGYEVEYMARWGNSTGQTAADWNIANLTDNAASGFQAGSSNFRQSGDPTPANDFNPNTAPPQPTTIDSTQGVPYGTIITNTLGAPNFLTGDYNKDGVVNAADYVVYRKTFGQTGSDTVERPADGNHDYVVGPTDYTVWRTHMAQPAGSGSGSGTGLDSSGISSTVPEPASWFLVALALFGATLLRTRPDALARANFRDLL